jgi:hypothetical protein
MADRIYMAIRLEVRSLPPLKGKGAVRDLDKIDFVVRSLA